MSVDKTLETRGGTHGVFAHGAFTSQALCRELRNGEHWTSLSDVQKEAIEMIAHKMARIVNGNPDFADHWHDIGGYAKLAEVLCIDYRQDPSK